MASITTDLSVCHKRKFDEISEPEKFVGVITPVVTNMSAACHIIDYHFDELVINASSQGTLPEILPIPKLVRCVNMA